MKHAGFGADFEADFFAAIHGVEVVEGVATEFGERGGGSGAFAALADDEFAFGNTNLFFGHEFFKNARAQKGLGEVGAILFIDFGFEAGAFHGDEGDSG